MIKYKWLKEYKELEEEIAYLKWNLNKTRLELARWEEGDLTKVRITNESKGAHVEEAITKIESDLMFREELKASLTILINAFEGFDNQLLRKKYVEGKTLEVIAEELDYSHVYIRHRHAEIVAGHSFIKECQERIKKFKRDTAEVDKKFRGKTNNENCISRIN